MVKINFPEIFFFIKGKVLELLFVKTQEQIKNI